MTTKEPPPLELQRLARMAEADNWLHDTRRHDRWPLSVRILIFVAGIVFSFAVWVGSIHLLATWWPTGTPCTSLTSGSAAALINCPPGEGR